MSKIAIVVTRAADLTRTLALLRRAAPESSLADLKQRLESGKPAVELVLFENDYPQLATRLRELIAALSLAGTDVRLFELERDEAFDPNADLARWEITRETLLNILESAKSYE